MEAQAQSTDDIFKALMRSDTEAVKTFIQNQVDLNAKNERGFTPLHIAALNGNDDLILLMIDKADPNIPDDDGLTPLHFATNEGYIECVTALLEHGADLHRISSDAVYYVSNHIPVYLPGGRTPLHFAAERGYDDVVLELLQRGAQLDARDNDGNDARTLALLNKQLDTAQLLHARQCPGAPFEPMTTEAIQIKSTQDHARRSERIGQLEKAKKKQRSGPPQCALYTPKQRQLTQLSDEHFDAAFIRALHANSPAALRQLMTEVCPGVYEFVLFTPQFCQELLAETEHYKQSGGPIQRPNSMNNYGLIFDHMSEAFRDMMHLLMLRYIRPLASALFAEVPASQLNQHHAFLVEYELGKDVKLDVHQDLSDVTLNVCLGRAFEGAAVYFEEPEGAWQPALGRAVIHLGSHRHGTRPLTSGFRANLIVWCRHNATAESAVY